MIRFTKKIGEKEYILEAPTVRELVELKQAIDPDCGLLKSKSNFPCETKMSIEEFLKINRGKGMTWYADGRVTVE